MSLFIISNEDQTAIGRITLRHYGMINGICCGFRSTAQRFLVLFSTFAVYQVPLLSQIHCKIQGRKTGIKIKLTHALHIPDFKILNMRVPHSDHYSKQSNSQRQTYRRSRTLSGAPFNSFNKSRVIILQLHLFDQH